MPTKLPVFCSPFWNRTEAERDLAICQWLEQPKPQRKPTVNLAASQPTPARSKGPRVTLIAEAFRDGGGRDWISRLVRDWKLDDYSLAELTAMTGLSESQLSRLRNEFSTSPGVLGLLAAVFGLPLGSPDHRRFAVKGLAAALSITDWLERSQVTRPNRTGRSRDPDQNDVFLLLVLAVGGLCQVWHGLTARYHDDLRRAGSDPELRCFLQQFSSCYLRLMTGLPDIERMAQVYFPGGTIPAESSWLLCSQLNSVWERYHLVWPRIWQVVDTLTPWYQLNLDVDEDEAA